METSNKTTDVLYGGDIETLPLTGLSPRVSVIVIILVVSVVILPMAFMGVPDGYDLMQHIRFAAAYKDAILSGEMIPKWPAKDNFGFGGIGIRYYPPLADYVLGIIRIITGSWYHSFWITVYGWALLGSLGIYAWVKEWTTNRAAMFAAILYILVPYHTFQIYQAVLYAEFAAAGILPFCFLYLTRVCRRRRWIDVVMLAISFSLLILTHIPTAIIASLCMAAYGLLLIDWRRLADTALKLGSAVFLSALAAAFHLVKALSEVDWVQHNSPQFFGKGYYNYKNYFFPIYFSTPWTKYLDKMQWQFDAMTSLTLLLFVIAGIAFFVNRKDRDELAARSKDNRAIIVTGLFSLFMLSAGSSFVWDSVPLLEKIQFPWRWLSIVSIMGSATFAVAAVSLIFRRGKINRFATYPIILIILAITLFDISQNIFPSAPLSKPVFDEKVVNMYDEEGCRCWWPIWAKSGAFAQPEPAVAGSRKATVTRWADESRDITVESGEAGTLRIATFYHPYWIAMVNANPAPVTADANGAIVVPIPASEARVQLIFREPRLLGWAVAASVFVWIGFAVFLVGYYLQRRKRME